MLLTTLFRGHAVDPMQIACYQSIALARGVRVWQEQRHDVWKKAWVMNQGTRTTHNTLGLVANVTRCLREMDATWEDAFTISPKNIKNISLIKGEYRKFKHDLREASRRARLRMISRKDLREDAAKGIGQAASLHLLRSKELT